MDRKEKAALVQAWVDEHLVPQPGCRVRAVDARDQAIRDLQLALDTRSITARVRAWREQRDGYTWILDTKLI